MKQWHYIIKKQGIIKGLSNWILSNLKYVNILDFSSDKGLFITQGMIRTSYYINQFERYEPWNEIDHWFDRQLQKINDNNDICYIERFTSTYINETNQLFDRCNDILGGYCRSFKQLEGIILNYK